jgi:hypothetical protein
MKTANLESKIYSQRLEVLNEEFKTDLASFREAKICLETENGTLRTEVDAQRENIERLEKNVENNVEENRGLKREYDALLEEYGKKGEVLSQLESQNRFLSEELQAKELEIVTFADNDQNYEDLNNTIDMKTKE